MGNLAVNNIRLQSVKRKYSLRWLSVIILRTNALLLK